MRALAAALSGLTHAKGPASKDPAELTAILACMPFDEEDSDQEAGDGVALSQCSREEQAAKLRLTGGDRMCMRASAVGIGVVALVACTAAALALSGGEGGSIGAEAPHSEGAGEQLLRAEFPQLRCSYLEAVACSAGTLLMSPEVREAATRSLMQVGRGMLLPKDEGAVRSAVAAGLRSLGGRLEASHHLGKLHVTREQRDASLQVLELLAEPRVQQLGRDVEDAMHGAAAKGGAKLQHGAVRQHISRALAPQAALLHRLRHELVPAPLQELWRQSDAPLWQASLREANTRTEQDERNLLAARVARPPNAGSALSAQQEQAAVQKGVAEEGRALLEVLRMCALSAGKELHLADQPDQAAVSCRGGSLAGGATEANGALLCPLRLGIQGLDALRAASKIEQDADIPQSAWGSSAISVSSPGL